MQTRPPVPPAARPWRAGEPCSPARPPLPSSLRSSCTSTWTSPADAVWQKVGGYCDISAWLKMTCALTAGKGELGSIRRLNDRIDEVMVAQTATSYTYTQPTSTILYHGTLEVVPNGANKSRINYSLFWDQAPLRRRRRETEGSRVAPESVHRRAREHEETRRGRLKAQHCRAPGASTRLIAGTGNADKAGPMADHVPAKTEGERCETSSRRASAWRECAIAALSLIGTTAVAPASAQEVADPGFKSVGRGAPVAADLRKYDIVGAALRRPFPPAAALPANLPIPLDPTTLAGQKPGDAPGAAPRQPVRRATAPRSSCARPRAAGQHRLGRTDSHQSGHLHRLRPRRRRARGHQAAAGRSSSRRRTSTRTRRSGPIRATSAATARPPSRSSGAPTARASSTPTAPKSAAWGYCDRDYPREAIVSPYPFKTAQEHYEALLAETKKRGGPTIHTYATRAR